MDSDWLESARMHECLGTVYFELGKFEEAVASYEKGVECRQEVTFNEDDEQIGQNWRIIGKIYHEKLEDSEAAEQFYDAALDNFTSQKTTEIIPQIAKVLKNRGNLFIDTENYEKAVGDLEECLRTEREIHGTD